MQIGTLIRNTQAGQSAPHSVRFQSGPPVHCAGGFVGGRWERCNVKFRLQDGGKHLRPEMTSRYAHIHDATMKEKLSEYLQGTSVGLTGKAVPEMDRSTLAISNGSPATFSRKHWDVNVSGVGLSSIYGVARCNVNNFCAAVRGDVHSGFARVLVGVQYADDGQSGGGGVQGISFGTSGFNYGVFGDAQGSTGSGAGVLGTAESPEGTGVVGKRSPPRGPRPACLVKPTAMRE